MVFKRVKILFAVTSALMLVLQNEFAVSEAKPKISPVVIVISMDGMRWDYPDRGALPGFSRMEKDGLRAGRMEATFPPNTFPSHVSLATGTRPELHGIIDNNFYDREKRKMADAYDIASWLEAEPIWVTAERQGKKAAVYYWLGSEGPWRGTQASYLKGRFSVVLSEQRKLDQIIKWLDLPEQRRPQLIMSYWHGADKFGHLFGPDSLAVTKQISVQDGYLHQLIQALDQRDAWAYTTLIVVSDHGMSAKKSVVPIVKYIKDASFKMWHTRSAAVTHITLDKEVSTKEAFEYFSSLKGFKTYYRDKMPPGLSVNHEQRSGDLVLLAEPGFYFADENMFEKQKSKLIAGGMHGLNPKLKDMGAIFFAMGRGVKPGSRLEQVQMIDVAPSISALLEIDAPSHAIGEAFLPLD